MTAFEAERFFCDNGFKGEGFKVNLWFLCFSGFFFQLAIDGDEGILIEAGIGFETRFGLLAAFENREIMVEETDTPFECFDRMIVLQGMCLTLRFFDQFAVCYASR